MSRIKQMTFELTGRGTSTVETMTFDQLRSMNDGGTQRADFHVVALVDGGLGSVTIDFRRYPLERRSAVWIAPGSVHQWDDFGDLDGHLNLFVPTAPVTAATRELVSATDLAAWWRVSAEQWPLIDVARTHLVLETERASGSDSSELPAILLSAFVTRLRRPDQGAHPTNPVFRAFRASVEANFRRHHDVGYYAGVLGYSARTLSRAAYQATGRSAKAYIVDRIVLEAKRLLAHDRLSAASCAAALGFPDASNFSVFFRKTTGLRPGAWQTATI
ncbi:helix-turn-helix domain-containing protein [Gordonia sp. DT30]|uniref:helix-turn-helix domain-containing protein n=1 Tax=Gordonia sp. DT30 TaxID=3416546 RepID=UPI003CEA010F